MNRIIELEIERLKQVGEKANSFRDIKKNIKFSVFGLQNTFSLITRGSYVDVLCDGKAIAVVDKVKGTKASIISALEAIKNVL